tara:strand:- start:594 stop:1271 length:678 start_codon:yes stop_codon:yes gene_type:complete
MGKNNKNKVSFAERLRGGYNSRVGIGDSGKVGKNEFSIDGKSFDYRDPRNMKYSDGHYADRIGDDGSAEDYGNRNSYEFTNPLYDYSFGDVRDAAKDLGIGNVNDKSEVKQILDRIQNGPTPTEEKTEDKPKKFLDKYIDKNITNESTKAEVEIPPAPIASGDGSINSPITQANPQSITGDGNVASQNNAINQSFDNSTDNTDNSTRTFLDNYRLNLGGKFNMFA